MDVATLNLFLALGTVALLAATAIMVVAYFVPAFGRQFLMERAARWGILKGFVLATAGSALTLIYSEIYGYPPCPLCWWQRVFLYPQVVLLATALYTRDKTVALYSIVLSALGLLVALYHHALQVMPSGTLPCPAVGTVSCGQRFVFEFGFVTFPMMAVALFAFLIILMVYVRKSR